MTAQEKFNHRGVAEVETSFVTSRRTVHASEEPIQLTFMAGRRHLRVNMDAREAYSLGRQLVQHAEKWQEEQKQQTEVGGGKQG